MSALPSYSEGSDKFGFNKKVLQQAYKTEKKLRKKAHEEAEKNFKKTIEDLKYEPVSGLAEQEETMATKVSLETFSRPKASRRSRRASLGMTLRILTPPSSPKLELEEIEPVVSLGDTSPLLAPPMLNRRSMLTKSMSCQLDAEALAGWKTLTFEDGPLGLQLEPTAGVKAARVTGFLDTSGCPSAARATGQINFNDVIVKVNATVPKSYEEALFLLGKGGNRSITFRPSFVYEVDETAIRRKKKSSKKKDKSSHGDSKKSKKKKEKSSHKSSHHKKKDKSKSSTHTRNDQAKKAEGDSVGESSDTESSTVSIHADDPY